MASIAAFFAILAIPIGFLRSSLPQASQIPIEETEPADELESLLSAMNVGQKAGQLLIIDLFGSQGDPITAVTDEVRARLSDVEPGGIVLYGANIDTAEQVTNLTRDLQFSSKIPLFIAVDHEGGIVNRFDDSGKIELTEIPSARLIGNIGDQDLAFQIGEVIGMELSVLGFNMNFAPVADIMIADDSVIGSRSFGSDPNLVADMVVPLVSGMQQNGVSAVLKHFPGHGAAVGDTHSGQVILNRTLDELIGAEFIPFVRGIQSGADGVMIAHLVVPSISADLTPSTSSKEIMTEILRGLLRFNKIAITDSLTMGAAEDAANGDAALESILAGSDILLRPANPAGIKQLIIKAVENGRLPISRLDDSVRRILAVKLSRGLFDGNPSSLESAEKLLNHPTHQVVVEKVYAKGQSSNRLR